MTDLISREEAIKRATADHDFYRGATLPTDKARRDELLNVMCWLNELPSVEQWHVIKKRPMTNDERIEWSGRIGYDLEDEEAFIYSNLPDDGEEVLVSSQYGNVYVDTFCQDEGCYFEDNGDMDGIVAWMEKPKPYKGDKK